MDAYERVSRTYFEEPDSIAYRNFYQALEVLAKKYARGNKILDLGCGDGTFLATLSREWVKLGLEPSLAGAELARSKNLDVTCGTLESSKRRFEPDLLSALDVIEHVIDPHAFVEGLKNQLKPGGVVLILTGDADSAPARIAGSQWSYLRWCGHVSVFTRQSISRLLTDHGFEIVDWRRCEHPSTPGAVAWWRVHMLEPIRRVLGRNKSWYPFWRDHQIVVARLV